MDGPCGHHKAGKSIMGSSQLHISSWAMITDCISYVTYNSSFVLLKNAIIIDAEVKQLLETLLGFAAYEHFLFMIFFLIIRQDNNTPHDADPSDQSCVTQYSLFVQKNMLCMLRGVRTV